MQEDFQKSSTVFTNTKNKENKEGRDLSVSSFLVMQKLLSNATEFLAEIWLSQAEAVETYCEIGLKTNRKGRISAGSHKDVYQSVGTGVLDGP